MRGVIEHTGTLDSFTPAEHSIVARFNAPPEILRYVIVKGPVAIDGISLTVIDKDDDDASPSAWSRTRRSTRTS